MRKLKFSSKGIALVCLLFISGSLSSQNLAITSGGFGHFSGGPTYSDASFVNSVVGSGVAGKGHYDLGNLGWFYGGEGFGLRDRWFYGGGGFALYMPTAETPEATVNFGMGGGYFKGGYLFRQKPLSFSYCFGSVGGGEMAITIKNRGEKYFVINDETNVSPYASNKYKKALVFFDAGLGSKFLVTPVAKDADRCGGLVLGIDVGCKLAVPVGNWQLKSKDVNISAHPTQVMPYIRLTFGGGIFNRG